MDFIVFACFSLVLFIVCRLETFSAGCVFPVRKIFLSSISKHFSKIMFPYNHCGIFNFSLNKWYASNFACFKLPNFAERERYREICPCIVILCIFVSMITIPVWFMDFRSVQTRKNFCCISGQLPQTWQTTILKLWFGHFINSCWNWSAVLLMPVNLLLAWKEYRGNNQK